MDSRSMLFSDLTESTLLRTACAFSPGWIRHRPIQARKPSMWIVSLEVTKKSTLVDTLPALTVTLALPSCDMLVPSNELITALDFSKDGLWFIFCQVLRGTEHISATASTLARIFERQISTISNHVLFRVTVPIDSLTYEMKNSSLLSVPYESASWRTSWTVLLRQHDAKCFFALHVWQVAHQARHFFLILDSWTLLHLRHGFRLEGLVSVSMSLIGLCCVCCLCFNTWTDLLADGIVIWDAFNIDDSSLCGIFDALQIAMVRLISKSFSFNSLSCRRLSVVLKTILSRIILSFLTVLKSHSAADSFKFVR